MKIRVKQRNESVTCGQCGFDLSLPVLCGLNVVVCDKGGNAEIEKGRLELGREIR